MSRLKEVPSHLQVEPELGVHSERLFQSHCGIWRDRPLSVNDFAQPWVRHSNCRGEVHLGQPKLAEGLIPTRYRPLTLPSCGRSPPTKACAPSSPRGASCCSRAWHRRWGRRARRGVGRTCSVWARAEWSAAVSELLAVQLGDHPPQRTSVARRERPELPAQS